MSCVLSIVGKDLDVDSFVKKTGISGFKKRYKGDIVSVKINKKLDYSYASIVISEADFDDLNTQLKEAEEYLTTNKSRLKCIGNTQGVDYATINFGANSSKDTVVKSFYFPISLISICAELQLGLELSVYRKESFYED